MMLSRRGFLGFLAAPAIVRAASLMPVKAFLEEEYLLKSLTVEYAPGYPIITYGGRASFSALMESFRLMQERVFVETVRRQSVDGLVAEAAEFESRTDAA